MGELSPPTTYAGGLGAVNIMDEKDVLESWEDADTKVYT